MKSIVFVLFAMVAPALCQNTFPMTSPQGHNGTDTRATQQDADDRRAFSQNPQDFQQQQVQDPNQRMMLTGAAVVPAIQLPPGTNIYPPQQQQQQLQGPAQYAGYGQGRSSYPYNTMPVQQQPQNDENSNLLKVMASRSFMDILKPHNMNQAEATQQLIPPLITDGMQKTLQQQQQQTAGQNTGMSPQGGYPQQGMNPYGGYPQQQQYPQQYGAMPNAYAPAYGQAAYPQQQMGAYPQQQQLGANGLYGGNGLGRR